MSRKAFASMALFAFVTWGGPIMWAQMKLPKVESTIAVPKVPSEEEASILRLQRDIASLRGGISDLNAQYASCKSMVDQYSDKNSAAFKALQQAQEQVQEMSKKLDELYKSLQKTGFVLDPNTLKYSPAETVPATAPPLPTNLPPGKKEK